MHALEIPESINSVIGSRGPAPVLAKLNRSVEVQASLVPMGVRQTSSSAEHRDMQRVGRSR